MHAGKKYKGCFYVSMEGTAGQSVQELGFSLKFHFSIDVEVYAVELINWSDNGG